MSSKRDPRYDILFESVRIGLGHGAEPVFSGATLQWLEQLGTTSGCPKCAGLKAEGGWGVVCTEIAEIHHSTELHPFSRRCRCGTTAISRSWR